MKNITVIAFPVAPVGKEDELWAQLNTLVQATRAEPGCISFVAHRHPDIHHRFAVYEKFSGQAAFNAHLEYAHTQAFIDWIQANGVILQFEKWNEMD